MSRMDGETGELVDPFGGRADLEAGIPRQPSEAFSEDPLRVRRGVQFAGRFGLEVVSETAALYQEMAPSFAELPKERVWVSSTRSLRRAPTSPGR